MRIRSLLAAMTVLLLPAPVVAAVSCPDWAPPPVLVPAKPGAKCQAAIAKAASAYAVARLGTLSKCGQQQQPGLCPRSEDVAAIEKAAQKAEKKILKACASAQPSLASSWATQGNAAALSQCTLSQHTASTAILVGIANGTPGRISDDRARDKCAQTLSKKAVTYVDSALGVMNTCFKKRMKKAAAGTDVASDCLPTWSGGALIPPADKKAAKGAGVKSKRRQPA